MTTFLLVLMLVMPDGSQAEYVIDYDLTWDDCETMVERMEKVHKLKAWCEYETDEVHPLDYYGAAKYANYKSH